MVRTTGARTTDHFGYQTCLYWELTATAMKHYLSPIVLVTLLSFLHSASAHHSAAPHFDMNARVEIEGVITNLALVNPHAYVYFDVTETGESVEWRCELRGGGILARAGWDENTLPPGANIKITGFPARREDNVCKSDMVSLSGGESVPVMEVARTYPSDGSPGTQVSRRADAENFSGRPKVLDNGQPNITGYWVATGRNANGRAQWPQTEAGIEASKTWDYRFDFAELRCEGSNIFETLYHDRHVNEFTQSEDELVLQYGFMDVRRVVHLDQDEHPENIDPSMVGHSVGHWEGQTLVVDTIGFKQGALIPPREILHSDQMHVIEHFTINGAGDLEWDFTATDPFIEEPFTGTLTLALTAEPYEPYGCIELSGKNNQRLP